MVETKTPFLSRVKNAWNVFTSRSDDSYYNWMSDIGSSWAGPYHRMSFTSGNEQSIIASIYNRAAIDVSQIALKHARIDPVTGSFVSNIDSGLNTCLSLSANIDQGARAFVQDVVISMFDEGAVAIVPVDTTLSIDDTNTFDILSLRVGQIVEWFPQHVRVKVYNDRTGQKETLILPKAKVGIVENPLFAVMNEPNSTLKRLISKLNLLDAIDEVSASGRLDIIVQLPYTVRSEQLKKRAEDRLASIEQQLKGSTHGIAYADGTEKIIQLNRPAENNLMGQIEFLTSMLYSQLGISDAIFNGTASQEEYLNYYNRTIEPIVVAITTELKRKFITPTAQAQGQSITYFRNPFSMVTALQLSEVADKFTRNEILTGNEVRGILGYQPSKDPGADELRNKNLNVPDSQLEE